MSEDDLKSAFESIARRMASDRQIYQNIGEILDASINKSFDSEGRYGELIDQVWTGGSSTWKPLAPSTIKQRTSRNKWPGKKLQVSGDLKDAMTYEVESDGVTIGNGRDYAEYLQFGTRRMPARPFIVIQDEDIIEIQHAVNDFFTRAYA